MTGPADPDDLLPEQRGDVPSADQLARRERGGGRWGRLRSWATILLALLALAACYFLLRQTR